MDRLQRQLTRLAAGGAIVLTGALAACGDARARSAETVVDSIVPRAVALARFRDGLPEVMALAGGAASREALVRDFLRALAAGDTVALRRMSLDRAEFAWLYYPTAPQGLPPYDLAPGLMWTMLELHGTQGLRQALAALGGRSARYVSHACDPRVSVEGANTLYGPCLVRLELDGAETEQRLFGLIIGRDGHFKFVSLANRID
jgi:hypothetical protein